MKPAKLLLASVALTALVGCSDSTSDTQTAVVPVEEHVTPKYNAVTDISSEGGRGVGGPAQGESGNSDVELAKQIKVALTTGSTGTTGVIAENQLTKIAVQVDQGVVTLTGPVTSESEKQWIENQVRGFKGVKSIQNNLTVGSRKVDRKPLQSLVPRGAGNE